MYEMKLPKDWKVERLQDVCNVIMGQSPPSTTYNDEGIGMPFLQGKAEFTELFPMPRENIVQNNFGFLLKEVFLCQ